VSPPTPVHNTTKARAQSLHSLIINEHDAARHVWGGRVKAARVLQDEDVAGQQVVVAKDLLGV
jgi:hypothetical protein